MPAKRKVPVKLRKDAKDNCTNYRLKATRIYLDCSLAELAEEVGLSYSAIESYERLRSFPDRKFARRITIALKRRLQSKLTEIATKELDVLPRYYLDGKVHVAVDLEVKDLFPYRVKEITCEVQEERRKMEKKFGKLGANLYDISYKLREENCNLAQENPFVSAVNNEGKRRENVEKALNNLNPRLSQIIRMRYGLWEEHGKEYTLKEVGKVLDISRGRVLQLEKRALRKFRHEYLITCRNDPDFIF